MTQLALGSLLGLFILSYIWHIIKYFDKVLLKNIEDENYFRAISYMFLQPVDYIKFLFRGGLTNN